ncbi:hypothetical protein Pyrde_1089 [Pyrodictium delaneyi]|uniref:Uncharacterized protein n=1 Tax=Pyrodictium delaneyi TaxID=1273541 RepID=A0A0N7JD41_9CREN|nr:hypothetical protein [Pyrodictium delaneyi]ALL01137.1 hypothetical protein Pyrde_1089 [Pyrodictium delaneyi]OWJ55287.1 hypothetical protein Pdsh_00190 [Pyrodictium delaneyi]
MSDELDYVPEDVLEEVLEAEKTIYPRQRAKMKPYPSARDVVEAVVEAVRSFSGHPDEFPDYVLEILHERGFDVRHVTMKRIWRTYENLVRKGVISDRLGVLYGD